MCTIGCACLDNTYIFKNRDPIRGTPFDERVERVTANDINMLVIRNDLGCYGGINQEGVCVVGTFVNMIADQNNYFDGDNLLEILGMGNIHRLLEFLQTNPSAYYGNLICSDGISSYAFELNGRETDCFSIEDRYLMTNHFQRINKAIRTINDPFIEEWTHSRLERGKALLDASLTRRDIELLLSDHKGYPELSICNHGRIPTASSYIFDCSQKKLYYCHGNPCSGSYVEQQI